LPQRQTSSSICTKAASQGAPQAIQVADRFHVCKNLTEATQLLLARCQAEIVTASQTPEPEQSGQPKQVISLAQWRPREPAHVEKVRLTRRAGRYARYQQVVALREQGMKPKQIAKRLEMGERTVRDWLKQATFPEAKKRREAGKVVLISLLLMCSSVGRRESTMGWLCGVRSEHKAIQDQSERSTATWKRSSKRQ